MDLKIIWSSANTVVYFDWKTVIYIYVCKKFRTQFMLPMEKSVTFNGACANEIIPSIDYSFVYKAKEGCHGTVKYTLKAHIYLLLIDGVAFTIFVPTICSLLCTSEN